MKRKSITDKSNIFQRSFSSALAGLPIAYVINLFIFIPLVYWMEGYPWWVIGIVGAIPFFLTSILRMWLIDYAWFKYRINVEPKHLFMRLFNGKK